MSANEYTRRVMGALAVTKYQPPAVFGSEVIDWWWSQLLAHWDWYMQGAEQARKTAADYRRQMANSGSAQLQNMFQWELPDLDKTAALGQAFAELRGALEARDTHAADAAIYQIVDVLRWPGERWLIDYGVACFPPSHILDKAWYGRWRAYTGGAVVGT